LAGGGPSAEPVRSGLAPVALVTALALAACSTAGTAPPALYIPPAPDLPLAQHELRDRVVAVVDEEAVLLSDVEEVIGLGLVDRQPGESDAALQARVLDGLIDHQLRFQAAERFGFGQVPVEDIEQQVDAIRDRFPDPTAFAARLAELGLTEAELRQLVARQLMVLHYVDERLGARVFVSLDDIRTYYDDELVPQLTSQGQPVPPLEEVREQIRQVIKQRRLLDEVETWTTGLRREADVQVFLDEPLEEMPPMVERIGGSTAAPGSTPPPTP